jgi:hypothetical protein
VATRARTATMRTKPRCHRNARHSKPGVLHMLAVMNASNAETRLDHFALGFVVLYFPIETWGSWPELWHPFYLDAVIGMLLLLWGIAKSRSDRRSALGVLCAGFAWMSATGWRSTFDRVFALADGGQLQYGPWEMCFVVCSTSLTVVGLTVSLVLLVRSRGAV